ncbi:MAG: hypothetical protein P8188_19225, partial [Gemmatimonadota bacterium]
MADEFGSEPGGTLFTSRKSRRRFPVHPLAGFGLLVLFAMGMGVAWYWLRSRESTPGPAPASVADSMAPA